MRVCFCEKRCHLLFHVICYLYVVTIKKLWSLAREVYNALGYSEKSKIEAITKEYCSQEKFTHKYQMSRVRAVWATVNWPKVSQKCDLYLNKGGIYELLFLSQQAKLKHLRRHTAIFLMFNSSLKGRCRKIISKQ